MGYDFQYPHLAWLFGGLLILFLLFFFLLRWKKKVQKRMGDPLLIKALIKDYSPQRFGLKFGVLSIAFVTGVLALMNLRTPAASEGISRNGIDVVIALDVSRSMLATDLAPSRMERARQFISKLMQAMPDDRVALVVFAGKAYLQMPLTNDHSAAQMYISSAGPGAVPTQGTIISEALDRAATAFNPAERRYKAVVLITDGEDHDEEAVSRAKELAGQGMMINTVGIGSPEGSYIPDPATGGNKKDQSGSQVISRLNETILQELAEVTNGVYVRLQETDPAVQTIKQQLSQIETRAYGDRSLLNYRTTYWWFAGLMLILLIAELFIRETRRRKQKANS